MKIGKIERLKQEAEKALKSEKTFYSFAFSAVKKNKPPCRKAMRDNL